MSHVYAQRKGTFHVWHWQINIYMRDLPKRGVGETKTECVCLQSVAEARPALYGKKHATIISSSHSSPALPKHWLRRASEACYNEGTSLTGIFFFEDKATTGRGYDSLLQSLLLLHLYWEKMT